MKKFKTSALLLCAISSIAMLSSCGKKGINENTIQFWHTFGKEIVVKLEKQISAFEKAIYDRDGVSISIEQSYQGDYDALSDKVLNGYATGNTPTITVAYPDNIADYLELESNKGDLVVNLDNYINSPEYGLGVKDDIFKEETKASDIVESFYEEGQNYKYQGTYSMPLMKSTEIMLYNEAVVSRALLDLGIEKDVDKYMKNITWDEFMALLQQIANNFEKYGMKDPEGGDSYALYYDSDANLFITQCYQRGIDYISMKDGKGSIDFNNSKAVELLNEFKGMRDAKLLTTKGSTDGRYGSDYFKAMRTAFVVGSTGGSGYSDPGVSFDVGVCKFPCYKGVPVEKQKYVSQGVTLGLLKNSSASKEVNDKKTRYGWEFIKYITSPTNNAELAMESKGYVPVRTSAYESEEYLEYLNDDGYSTEVAKSVINEINGNYFNYPVFKGSAEARTQSEGAVKQVLLGKLTPEKALEEAYKEAIKKAQ